MENQHSVLLHLLNLRYVPLRWVKVAILKWPIFLPIPRNWPFFRRIGHFWVHYVQTLKIKGIGYNSKGSDKVQFNRNWQEELATSKSPLLSIYLAWSVYVFSMSKPNQCQNNMKLVNFCQYSSTMERKVDVLSLCTYTPWLADCYF